MTKFIRQAAAVVLGLTAVALFAAAGGTATGIKARPAGGPINAVSMSGTRVAYDVGDARLSPGVGNRVVVWDTRSGKVTKVSGKTTSLADITSTGQGVRELAISGQRVAWIVNSGGNTESDDYLCASTLTRPKEQKLASAMRTGPDPYSLQGNWIGGLVGSTDLLVVNRWTTDPDGLITRAGLDVVGTKSLRRIASSAATLLAQSADSGRLAVLRSNGVITVYSTAGKPLFTVSPSAKARGVAVHGSYLVALTTARRLEVYSAKTGAPLKTWLARGPLAHPPVSLDVEGNLAVYAAGRELRVVQLLTGKDKVLATMSRGIAFAQIEAPGVVYAGNIPSNGQTLGRLTYIPFARVAAAVS